jgi:hypothetical protein
MPALPSLGHMHSTLLLSETFLKEIYIYIYIYIEREREREREIATVRSQSTVLKVVRTLS